MTSNWNRTIDAQCPKPNQAPGCAPKEESKGHHERKDHQEPKEHQPSA